MLFAYNDDGRLEVVADEAEARNNFAASDVEAGVIRLFDENGKVMTPTFPDRKSKKFLGMTLSSDPGPFHLMPSGADGERLLESLGPTIVVMPNRWFKDIDAVKAHLAARAT
jgi:hypothetical protein